MCEVLKEQQVHEDARKVYGAEVFVNFLVEKWEKKYLESHELVDGTRIAELLQARASGRQGTWQDDETNSDSRRWQGSCQRGQRLETLKGKEEDHQEEPQNTLT